MWSGVVRSIPYEFPLSEKLTPVEAAAIENGVIDAAVKVCVATVLFWPFIVANALTATFTLPYT